jgi:hypothetical protein
MIEDQIYSALNGLAGGRIYPIVIEQRADGPMIVFQRVSATRETTLNKSVDIVNPQMAIIAYAQDRQSARNTADEIKAAMRISTIMGSLIDEAETYDPETQLFGVQMTYSCWEIET